jgi:hypothetical protein
MFKMVENVHSSWLNKGMSEIRPQLADPAVYLRYVVDADLTQRREAACARRLRRRLRRS